MVWKITSLYFFWTGMNYPDYFLLRHLLNFHIPFHIVKQNYIFKWNKMNYHSASDPQINSSFVFTELIFSVLLTFSHRYLHHKVPCRVLSIKSWLLFWIPFRSTTTKLFITIITSKFIRGKEIWTRQKIRNTNIQLNVKTCTFQQHIVSWVSMNK